MQLGNIIVGILIILAVFGIGYAIIQEMRFQTNECLENIAREYCEDRDWAYSIHSWDFGNENFRCRTNERSMESNGYFFTEEELDKCWN